MNSIVRVGDGDRLQRAMESFGWPSIVYCPQGLKPTAAGCSLLQTYSLPVFHKTLSKYTPKNSFKMRFVYISRAKYVHFLVCKLQNQISTLDSLHNSRLHFYFKIYSLKDISNFRYSNQNIITLVIIAHSLLTVLLGQSLFIIYIHNERIVMIYIYY